MEILGSENAVDACRLCLKHDGIKLPIFGEVAVQRDVANKINICFALVVYETDPLSKLICHRCLYKLEQSYEFRSDVLSVFEHLKKALLQRRSDPEIEKYLTAVEDQVIVIGSPKTWQSDYHHGSEPIDDTFHNEDVQLSGACATFLGDSPEDSDECVEIVKHTPFDERPGLNLNDAGSENYTEHSTSEGNNIFINDKNEITCKSDAVSSQSCCDKRKDAGKQEIGHHRTARPQNISETFSKPQLGGRSAQNQKHGASMKNRPSAVPGSVNLQWCNFCQKYLKNKEQFRRHCIRVHNIIRPAIYSCKCKRKFHTLLEMLTHQQTHLRVQIKVTEDRLLKCNLCDKKFADNSILTSHLITHSNKYNSRHPFKACTNKHGVKDSWMKQRKVGDIKATSSPSELFVCDHCRLIFKTASSLSLHLNSKQCFILCDCPITDKNNVSNSSSVCKMRQIMRASRENTVLPNKQISNIVTDNMIQLSNKTESGESQKTSTDHSVAQVSDDTVSATTQKNSADSNQQSLEDPINKCTVCAKVYGSQQSLRRHQKKHTTSNRTNFSCTFCKRIFVTHSSLVSHLHKHSSDGRFHCKYCSKIYPNKQLFLKHKCLINKAYPFCDLQLSRSPVVAHSHQPHQNMKGYSGLSDHNAVSKAMQINASVNDQTKEKNNFKQCKSHKRVKKGTGDYNRASHISKNDNCVKCPFCHRLVKPELVYQHIYENHPDSGNVNQ